MQKTIDSQFSRLAENRGIDPQSVIVQFGEQVDLDPVQRPAQPLASPEQQEQGGILDRLSSRIGESLGVTTGSGGSV